MHDRGRDGRRYVCVEIQHVLANSIGVRFMIGSSMARVRESYKFKSCARELSVPGGNNFSVFVNDAARVDVAAADKCLAWWSHIELARYGTSWGGLQSNTHDVQSRV